jgi:hypothetical protein
MKKLLFLFDTDPYASVFDTVVAYDGGADRVHDPRRKTADKNKHCFRRAVLNEIATVFKCSEAKSYGKRRADDFFFFGVEQSNINKQGERFHNFLANRRKLYGGLGGIQPVPIQSGCRNNKKVVYIRGQHEDGVTDCK